MTLTREGRIGVFISLALRITILYLASNSLLAGQSLRATPTAGSPINAPAAARGWKNPYEERSDAAEAGAKLFRQHCAGCHGDDARGQGKAPSLRSEPVEDAPPGVLFWFLKNGNLRHGMPSWSGLPDQQRWQLVSYLQQPR